MLGAMRIVVLRCGDAPDVDLAALPDDLRLADGSRLGGVTVVKHDLPTRPGRSDLAFLADIAAEVLPVDDAPTPAQISASKEVPELGDPELAPQRPSEPVRVLVAGPDASLAAVVTALLRRNLLWIEVAHIPGGPTPATRNYGLDDGLDLRQALTRPVRPVPCIRDDTGSAIVGYALLTGPDATGTSSRGGLVGEVWVNEHALFSGTAHGVQVRPTPDAPGLVAAELPPPAEAQERRGVLGRLFGRRDQGADLDEGLTDAHGTPRLMHEPLTGRAVQAGGPGFRYVRDGVEAKRPKEKTTLYRHLRDLQLVR